MKTSLILRGAAIAAIAALGYSAQASAEASKELHVLWSGGQYGDAVEKCINEPFTAATGIKVITESPGGLAKLQAMAEAGSITSTVFDLPTDELKRGTAQGLFEKVDWKAVDPEPIYDEAKDEYAVGTSYFSTIMAYRSDAKAPQNWVDFFDTKNFPGKRALPDYPGYVLPFAAIADGVPVDKVFPIDLDRAFKTLERIKGDTIWWQAGAQSAQLLKDNEAQYVIAWSGRVVGQDGITTSFKDGMLDISWFGVAKGAPEAEKEAAWKWLHWHTNAKAEACVANYISYTGPSEGLDALLPKDKLTQYPTYSENKKVQWLANAQWWLDHADEVEKRWQEFKLQQ
jgi:putative spermidine/putrescine transport system substrate-binding protein